MKTPKEIINAEQQEVDRERSKLKMSLLEEEKQKHTAMETAIHLMSQANIKAYVFADLPNPEYPIGIPCIYQFNTLIGSVKYDEDGGIIASDEAMLFSAALLRVIFEHYTMHSIGAKKMGLDKLDSSNPESFKKRLDYMSYSIYDAVKYCQDKVKEILDDSQ
jgi:hypothetical protein